MTWTSADVHEALLRWGAMAVRLQDGGLGYPSQAPWIRERVGTSYTALAPGEYTTLEYQQIEAAMTLLPQPLKVVLLAYYKPGHLRATAGLGLDGKGRQRSPSLRTIAAHMLISKDAVVLRLQQARTIIARELTDAQY